MIGRRRRITRLRFRVYVDQQLASEHWVELDGTKASLDRAAEDLATVHSEITRAAELAGRVWLVEVCDPFVPAERGFLRFGTDTSMMHDPVPITMGRWAEGAAAWN